MKKHIPHQETVDRQRFEIRLSEEDILIPGVVVYHFSFEDQGKTIPTYITISSFDMNLWILAQG